MTGKNNRNRMVKIRVTDAEENLLKDLADKRGVTLSEYMRQCCLKGKALKGPQGTKQN